MMQFTATVLACASLLTVAVGAAVKDPSDLPYPIVPFKYNGTLGDHDVEINGTVEEIYAKMKVLHPEFDADHAIQAGAEASVQMVNSKSNTLCCPVNGRSWDYAGTARILEGVKYLKGIDICDVGALSCVRISCSYSAAIYLCNDNTDVIRPKCNYIATYAEDLVRDCSISRRFDDYGTCGQKFDTDRYNVIVHSDRC